MKPVRRPAHVVFPPTTPQPAPAAGQRRGKVQKRGSFLGGGCLLQGFGLLCLLTAAMFAIGFLLGGWEGLFGAPYYGLLGLWMLVYGRKIAVWRECSLCGGKLSHPRVRICPHCRSDLRPS